MSTVIVLATLLGAGACGDSTASRPRPEPSPAPPPTSDAPAIASSDAATELAGRAAMAADRDFEAVYQLHRDGKQESDGVDVTVTLAQDGTWQVDVPGGAHGGKADVVIAWNKDAYFQCAEGKKDRCVPIAKPEEDLPADVDPEVQHVFTDWLESMRDRSNPLSVAFTETLDGAGSGSHCYSVQSNSVTVAAPVPSGTYCLRADGTITAAKSGFGLLLLAGKPQAGPEELELPEDVASDASPLPTSPPPSPSPSKTRDPSPSESD